MDEPIEIIHCTENERGAWDDFVKKNESSNIGHLFAWKKITEQGLGHRTQYLMAKVGGKVRGILPLAYIKTWWGKRFYVSLPWIDYAGICADNQDIAAALAGYAEKMAQEKGADFVELRSIEPLLPGKPIRTDKVTFRLQLDNNPETIWKKFDAKLRNQIRKADKSELTTDIFGRERIDDFYKIFSWKMRALGTPVWGKIFFENILIEFPQLAKIILVFKDSKPIAGGLLLAFKDTLYVPSASSYDEYLKYCPNHALYWHVIRYGCANGYRLFDFGRSTWNSPTFNFKKQWAFEPIQLHWQYSLLKASELPAMNPDNPKYKKLIELWKRLPLWFTNLVGPKVIKNFP